MKRSDRGCRHSWQRKLLAVAVASCFATKFAYANPAGPTLVNPQNGAVFYNGKPYFNINGNLLEIKVAPGTIINWQSFSISANETTRFIQQSSSSAVLNRITGGDPSVILGALQSNGRVLLINPNGIVFGAGASIDTAGLVASSLKLSDTDFAAGRLRFTEVAGAGGVTNQGSITTPAGGFVYIVAPNIQNSGIIRSEGGEVILAAGKTVELINPVSPDVRVTVTAADNQAVNLGQIIASKIGVYGGLIRQSGVVNANTAVRGENGRVVFKASGNVTLAAGSRTTANGPSGGSITIQSDTGSVLVAGVVEANGTQGKGGTIAVSAPQSIVIEPTARISASGAEGGSVTLSSGGSVAVAAAVAANASIGNAGQIAVNAATTAVIASTGQLSASGGQTGGAVLLQGNSGVTLEAGSSLRANGAAGGSVVVRADNGAVTARGLIDATGVGANGGNIKVGARYDITLDISSKILAGGRAGGTMRIESTEGRLVASGLIDGQGSNGPGGLVWLLAPRVALIRGTQINVSGLTGGGTVLVGGDYQGRNTTIQNALQTYVGSDVRILADAIDSGSGGKVIVWADNNTQFYGAISAQGGARGGNGGFTEVSGKQFLDFNGTVNLNAANGISGTLLLDPTDITISAAVNTIEGPTAGTFQETTPTNTSVLNTTTLQNALATANVIVTTVSGAAGSGNITVAGTITAPASGNHSLTLSAENSIIINAGANINFTASAGNVSLLAATAAGNTTGSITTAGGQILMGGGSLLLKAAAGITATTTAPLLSVNNTASGNVAISNTGAVSLSGVTQSGGNFALTATGAISQTGVAAVSGASTFTTGAAAITLTQANNFSGAVSLTNTNTNNIAITNAGALTLGIISMSNAAGTLTVVSNGAIAQSGVTTITTGTGAVSFNSGAAGSAISLGNNNDFRGAVALSNTGANDVSIKDVNALTFGALNIGGNFNASAAGALAFNATASVGGNLTATTSGASAITQTGALTVTGAAGFTTGGAAITLTQANDFIGAVSLTNTGGNVAVTDRNALILGTVSMANAANTLTVAANGAITQSGATTITTGTGAVNFNSGAAGNAITLGNNNDFRGTVAVTSSGANDVAITDINALTLGATSIGGNFNVTAAGALAFNGITAVGGNLTATTSGASAITQTGAFSVTGTSAFATGAGAVTLNNAGNNFGAAVSLSNAGGNIAITNANALTLGTVSMANSANTLIVVANGAITQAGATTITTGSGAVSFNSGAAGSAITLTNNNDFRGAVALTTAGAGGSIAITDANALTLGTLAMGNAASTLTVISNGAITQSGATIMTTGTGAVSFNSGAAGSPITLTNANDFRGPVALTTQTAAGNISLRDINALTLGAVSMTNAAGSLTIVSNGAIAQSGATTITTGSGAVSFNSGAAGNPITLTNNNDFLGPVALTTSGAAGNIAINDINALAFGTVLMANAAGRLTVTSAGAITQSGATTITTGTGAVSFNSSGTNPITLTNNNDFRGVVALTGGDAQIRDANAITLGVLTTGNIFVQAATDITLSTAVNLASAATFVAQAGRNVNVNATLTTNGGYIILEADSPHAASGAANGAGQVAINANVSSNGGHIALIGGGNAIQSGGGIVLGADVNAGAGGLNIALTNNAPLGIGVIGIVTQILGNPIDHLITTGALVLGTAVTSGPGAQLTAVTENPLTGAVTLLANAISNVFTGSNILVNAAPSSFSLVSGSGGILLSLPLNTTQNTILNTTGALTINANITTTGTLSVLNATSVTLGNNVTITAAPGGVCTAAIGCGSVTGSNTGIDTWIGGIDQNWFTAGNWSLNAAPTSSNIVIIPAGIDTINIAGATAAQAATLTDGRPLLVTGTLKLFGTSTINNSFTLQGGTLTTTNAVTLGGSSGLTWSGGTMDGSGGTFLYTGTLGGTLSGSLTLNIPFLNQSGSALTLSGATIGGTGSFSNLGALTATGTSALNVALSNSGTLMLSGATLGGTGLISNPGLITTRFGTANTINSAFAAATNAGIIQVNGAGSNSPGASTSLTIANSLANTGTIELKGDANGATNLTITAPATLANAGTITVAGGTSNSINVASSALTNTGTILVDGTASATSLAISNGFANAGTIEIRSGSDISGNTAAFSVGAGTLANNGTIKTAVGTLNTIDIAGTLNNSGTGIIQVDGTGTASPVSLTIAHGFSNAGTIRLNSDANSAATLAVTSGTLANTGTISSLGTLGTAQVNTLNAPVSSSGTIDLVNALAIGGNLTINTGGTLTGGGELAVNGNLNWTSNSSITQSGTLLVSGTTTLTADSNAIAVNLATRTNNFNTVTLVAGTGSFTSVSVLDADAIAVANGAAATGMSANGMSIGGNAATLTANSVGALTLTGGTYGVLNAISQSSIGQSGALTVTGATTLTADTTAGVSATLVTAGNDFNTVSLTTAGAPIAGSFGTVSLKDTSGGMVLAGGTATNLNVTSTGGITQSTAPLIVSGTTILTADTVGNQTFNLATQNNDFGTVTLATTNAGTIGTASLQAANGIILGGGAATTLNVTAGAGITQSGVLSIAGTTTLTAGSPSSPADITLNNGANDFSTVSIVRGNNVALADGNGIVLGGSTISGTLDVVTNGTAATGTIGQSGVISIAGVTTLTAGAAATPSAITLNNIANDFAVVSVLRGSNVALSDANGIVLGNLTVSGTLDVITNGTAATGAITQNGVLSVAGVTTLTAGAAATPADITLNNSANDFSTVTVARGNNVALSDANGLVLGGATVGGTLDVITNGTAVTGAITQSGALLVTGATTLTAGAAATPGDIVLNNSANDFSTASVVRGNNVTLNDANNLVLGTINANGAAGVVNIGFGKGGAGGTLDLSGATFVAATVNAAGGAGSDTIIAANRANTWTINNLNAGTLNSINFSAVENLTGGTAGNTFLLVNNGATTHGALGGTINGGGGAGNTLDYSGTVGTVAVVLATQNSGTATNTGGFSNIQALAGNGASTTLTGTAGSTYNLAGTNAGNVNTTFGFSAVGNLTDSGAGVFNMHTTGDGGVTGNISANGGTVDYTGYTIAPTFALGGGASTGMAGWSGIATVIGRAASDGTMTGSAQTYNLTAADAGNNASVSWTNFRNITDTGSGGRVNMHGGATDGSLSGNLVLSGGTLSYSNYSSAVTVELTGAANKTTGITGTWSGVTTLAGSANADTVTASGATYTLNNTISNAGSNGTVSWSGFENITDTGTAGKVVFGTGGGLTGKATIPGGTLDYTNYTAGAVTVNLATSTATATGGFGGVTLLKGSANTADTISDSGATYTLNNATANAGSNGTVTWSGFESIVDVGVGGKLVFGTAGGLAGAVTLPNGTLDYTNYAAGAVTVNLSTGAATATGGFGGVTAIKGSAASDTIAGNNQTYHLTGTNAGDNGTVFWTSFENLGATGASTITGAGGSLSGNLSSATTALGGTITTVGTQSYSGPVTAGAVTLNAGTSAITANAANHFSGTLTATGNTIQVNNTGALTVVLNDTGTSTISAGGALQVSGSVAGTLNATTTGGTASTTSFGITSAGVLVSNSTGAIAQTGALTVAGTASFNAGANAITLATGGNDFKAAVTATGNTIRISDANALTVALSDTGTSSVNAAGALTVSGNVTGTLNTTTTGGTAGTTSFGATNAGALASTSTGAVSQSGIVKVTGVSSIDSGSNSITLNNSSNDFTGSVSVTGGATRISDANTLVLGAITVAGDLALIAGSQVTVNNAIVSASGAVGVIAPTLLVNASTAPAQLKAGTNLGVVASSVTLQGGAGNGAYAEIFGGPGTFAISTSNDIVLNGGAGGGAYARIFGNPDVNLIIGGILQLNAGAGSGAFARIESFLPTSINIVFPNIASGGFAVSGAGSGFIAGSAPAITGTNLNLFYGLGTATVPPPPPTVTVVGNTTSATSTASVAGTTTSTVTEIVTITPTSVDISFIQTGANTGAILPPPPPPPAGVLNSGGPAVISNNNDASLTHATTTVGSLSGTSFVGLNSAGALIDTGTNQIITLQSVAQIDAGTYTNIETGQPVFIQNIASAEPGTYISQSNTTVVVVKADDKTGQKVATAGAAPKSTTKSAKMKALPFCK